MTKRKLQIGSCFSGIGGLELGLEATGFFETKWQVEIEDFPTKVLEKHWPGVRRWRDVRTFPPEGDWSCDILVAGFPCQDISTAGPGGGLSGERSGLFYELLRIIDLIRPRWLLLENVPAILYRGADDVLRHLAEIGLRNDNPHFRRMESHCFSAAHIGAAHRRDRWFCIAHSEHPRPHWFRTNEYKCECEKVGWHKQSWWDGCDWTLADTQCCGYTGSGSSGDGVHEQTNKRREAIIALPMRQYGVWAFEPEVCRVVDGPAARIHRAKRLKALGNAVVPQAAHYIGHNIVSYINDCA